MENAGKYPLSSFTLIGHVIRRRNRAQILWKIFVSTHKRRGSISNISATLLPLWQFKSASASLAAKHQSHCGKVWPTNMCGAEVCHTTFFGQLGASMCWLTSMLWTNGVAFFPSIGIHFFMEVAVSRWKELFKLVKLCFYDCQREEKTHFE